MGRKAKRQCESSDPVAGNATAPWDRQVDSQWYIDLREDLPLEMRPLEVQWYLCAVGLFGKHPRGEWEAHLKELDSPNAGLAQEGVTLLREKWAEGKGLFLPDESKDFARMDSISWWEMLLSVKKEETSIGGELKPITGEGKVVNSFNDKGWVPWAWLCDLKHSERLLGVSAGPSAAYKLLAEGCSLEHPKGQHLVLTNLRPSYHLATAVVLTLNHVVTMYEVSCHPAFGVASCYDIYYDEHGEDNKAFIEAYDKAVNQVAGDPESQNSGGDGGDPESQESTDTTGTASSLSSREEMAREIPDWDPARSIWNKCDIQQASWTFTAECANRRLGGTGVF